MQVRSISIITRTEFVYFSEVGKNPLFPGDNRGIIMAQKELVIYASHYPNP